MVNIFRDVPKGADEGLERVETQLTYAFVVSLFLVVASLYLNLQLEEETRTVVVRQPSFGDYVTLASDPKIGPLMRCPCTQPMLKKADFATVEYALLPVCRAASFENPPGGCNYENISAEFCVGSTCFGSIDQETITSFYSSADVTF